jgi:predicted lipid carrier protein YhbT
MAQRFDQGRAAGVDLTVRFHLTGPGGGSWLVTVRDGTLSVEQDPDEEAVADVTIRSGADDYLRIVNGELSGADAFSTRRLVVDGDLARAAALAELGLV